MSGTEGTDAFDDLRTQFLSVRHTTSFLPIFRGISSRLKDRFHHRQRAFQQNRPDQPFTTVTYWEGR
jgi:hypothetical protein